MNTKTLIAFICCLAGLIASANTQSTYRDSMGRNKGTSSTSGNYTTYRDG